MALCVLIAVLFGKGLAHRNSVLIGGVVLWVPVLLLCMHQEMLVMAIITLFASDFQIPGLPNDLMISHILGIIMVGLVFLKILMKQETKAKTGGGLYRFMLIALAIVVLVTMYFRGAGFRMLGDSQWGGMRYISILVGIGMLWAVSYVSISANRLRTALKLMCIFALVPFISEVLLLMFGEKVSWISLFVRNARLSELGINGGLGSARIYAGNLAAPIIVLFPFIVRSYSQKKHTIITGLCVFIAYAMAMFSGHRISFAAVTLFLFGYIWLSGETSKPYIVFMSLLGALFGFVILALTVDKLPYAIQRTVSWIPFIKVNARTAVEAHSTILWRIGVWKDAVKEIPKYFWLGKGYTFDPMAMRSLRMFGHYVRDWAKINVAYHNAHLSLLIGLGIFGYITGISSILLIFKRHFDFMKAQWQHESLKKLHLVFFIRLAVMIIVFLFIYGDAYVSIPPILFTTMILELIRQTDCREIDATASQ